MTPSRDTNNSDVLCSLDQLTSDELEQLARAVAIEITRREQESP